MRLRKTIAKKSRSTVSCHRYGLNSKFKMNYGATKALKNETRNQNLKG